MTLADSQETVLHWSGSAADFMRQYLPNMRMFACRYCGRVYVVDKDRFVICCGHINRPDDGNPPTTEVYGQ